MQILRYPGSKYRLSETILRMIPSSGIPFAESFAGSAAVAVKIAERDRKRKIILIDKDPRIAELWKTICCGGAHELADRIFRYVPSVDDFMDRKTRNDALSTIVVSRCSFSGRGGGPIGGAKQQGRWLIDARWNGAELSRTVLHLGHIFEGRTEVFEGNYESYRDLLSGAFVYADPPYWKAGAVLYEHSFTPKNHSDLALWLKSRNNWLLSYDSAQEIINFYGGCDISRVEVQDAAEKIRLNVERIEAEHVPRRLDTTKVNGGHARFG